MNPIAGYLARLSSGLSSKESRPGNLLQVVGWLCLVMALGSFISSWRFVSTAHRATAVVSEWREQKGRAGLLYAPTFMFRDAAGKQHTKVSKAFRSQPRYQVGALVPILYVPSKPAEARLDSYRELWGDASLALIAGGLCLLAGFIAGSRSKIQAERRRPQRT